MENLVQDVRLALRALRRNPGFGTAALLTLALGIGGTCAVFSVVNDIYLRPLPFAHEDRLLRLRDSTRTPGGAIVTVNTNAPHFLEIAAQTRTLSGLSAQLGRSATLTGADLPAHVDEALLSPGSLAVLGVQPVLGRGFSKDEEQQGEGAGVALISANLWHARLGGDAQALGRTIEVDGRPLRVVGVLPPGYRFPYDADVWLPLRLADAAADDFAVFARMAPGATLGEVRAELDSIASRMPGRDSRTLPGYGIEAVPLRKSLLADEDRVAVALLAVL
ncbi:MAG TPA: ABC transporter permease, partial [Myxococcales bacterium]|nr:ABC transporter permease [Myxococcales bacterium]